jgi:ubiquinone biosynthesis monooxygenase Coq7
MSPASNPAFTSERRLSPTDRLIAPLDAALRTLLGANDATRPYPAAQVDETVETSADRKHVAALMRVNHAGEVAAQALYQGQALLSQTPAIRDALMAAGREETDHLAWCATRIDELGGRTSLLNPLWYAGSFAIGALAGLAGDKASLGFVAETERQVVEHLEGHMHELPNGDARTHAILEQMRTDEAHHGASAIDAGGTRLPTITRRAMRLVARVMTRTSYWL